MSKAAYELGSPGGADKSHELDASRLVSMWKHIERDEKRLAGAMPPVVSLMALDESLILRLFVADVLSHFEESAEGGQTAQLLGELIAASSATQSPRLTRCLERALQGHPLPWLGQLAGDEGSGSH